MRRPDSRRVSPLEWAALLLVSLCFLGTFLSYGGFHASKEPSDYYGMLTDALCSGQAHLKIAPDPRLASMANPWADNQAIPQLRDASYFHGQYFLYFGVAPVVLLLGPWHLLFGSYLSEAQANAIFAYLAILAGLPLLRHWARLFEVGPKCRAVGILVWGLGSSALLVAQEPTFYFTVISCGIFCRMIAFAFVLRALSARSSRASALWIAAASAAWGMSVASRPHFVFSLPLLAIPAAWLLWRGTLFPSFRQKVELIAACLVPAGLIGLGQAAYNYARFGSPLEFGFHYQFAIGGDHLHMSMWNPRMIWGNLKYYMLRGTTWYLYFPFAVQILGASSVFTWAPITLFSVGLPAGMAVKRLRGIPTWCWLAGMLLLAGLIHLLVLGAQSFVATRYAGDFWPEFTLVGLAVAYASLGRGFELSPRSRRLITALFSVVSAITIVKCTCLYLQAAHSESLRTEAESLLNLPLGSVQVGTDSLRGPYKLDLSFEPLQVGRNTPLLETSVGSDAIFVRRIDADRVQLGFEHKGNVPILGDIVRIRHGYRQIVTVDMGSLYPPTLHPFFKGWDPAAIDLLHERAQATVDGRLVLDTRSDFYRSDPRHEYVGRDVAGLEDNTAPVAIYRVSRLHVPAASEVLASGWVGPVRLTLRLPRYQVFMSEPLLSTGADGATDMIYVTYHGPGQISLGQDGVSFGSIDSEVLTVDPDAEHVLEVDYGALDAAGKIGRPVPEGLRMRFDGQWIINAPRPSHFTLPAQVALGFNSGTLGTAQSAFTGPELRAEHMPALKAGVAQLRGPGALMATLQLEPMRAGTIEPLVTLGRTGAADIVFARFLGTQRIVLGVDHWGVGSAESAPVNFKLGSLHTLTIRSAGLDPRDGAGIHVEWDGHPAVEAPWDGFPAPADMIALGRNPAGGSTPNVLEMVGAFVEAHREHTGTVNSPVSSGRN